MGQNNLREFYGYSIFYNTSSIETYKCLFWSAKHSTRQRRKKSPGGSFSEHELQIRVTEVHKSVLQAYGTALPVPNSKWSSLKKLVEERIDYAGNLFPAIITARCFGFEVKHPVLETTEKSTLLSTFSLEADDPSPSPSPTEIGTRTVEANLNRLLLRLQKYQKRLQDNSLQIKFKSLMEYEFLLWNHYSKKVSGLSLCSQVEPVEEFSADPKCEFKLLERVKKQIKRQSAEIQKLFDLIIPHAQAIYDHYKATWAKNYLSCAQKLDDLDKIHATFIPQLDTAKEQRRYKDEDAAQEVLFKLQKRCEEKQDLYYNKINPRWEEMKHVEKDVVCKKGSCYGWTYCIGSHKGGRTTKKVIEDKVLSIGVYCKINGKKYSIPLVAVFDGHGRDPSGLGGDQAAIHCQQNLPRILIDALVANNESGFSLDGIFNAAKDACIKLHEGAPKVSGTTALFAFCIDDQWYVASVGDSRGVIFYDRPIPMTMDASASDPSCKEKVRLRGGNVVLKDGCERVQGIGLSMTKSIGDKEGKHVLSHTPTVNVFKVPEKSEQNIYLMLCSDGVTHVVSHQQLLDFIRECEKKNMSMHAIATSILKITAAFQAGPGGDDVSVILVKLNK